MRNDLRKERYRPPSPHETINEEQAAIMSSANSLMRNKVAQKRVAQMTHPRNMHGNMSVRVTSRRCLPAPLKVAS